MDNEELYEAATSAISDLFSDTSVDVEATRENLLGLINDIGVMLDRISV